MPYNERIVSAEGMKTGVFCRPAGILKVYSQQRKKVTGGFL